MTTEWCLSFYNTVAPFRHCKFYMQVHVLNVVCTTQYFAIKIHVIFKLANMKIHVNNFQLSQVDTCCAKIPPKSHYNYSYLIVNISNDNTA